MSTISYGIATGSNAHAQLRPDKADVFEVLPLSLPGSTTDDAQILLVTWSQIVYRTRSDSPLFSQGFGAGEISLEPANTSKIISVFGNGIELLGALDDQGEMYLLKHGCLEPAGSSSRDGRILLKRVRRREGCGLRISHVAIAGNGRVAVAFTSQATDCSTRIELFESTEALRDWREGDEDAAAAEGWQVTTDNITQLVANETAFAYLTNKGAVYTWGDPRYRSLGRSTLTSEKGTSADKPGRVASLNGMHITKLVAAGWMMGAVSPGRAWVWGSSPPGSSQAEDEDNGNELGEALRAILTPDSADERIALVEIPNPASGLGNLLCVSDLAMGTEHIIVLAGSDIYGVGGNGSGQLGLGHGRNSCLTWTKVAGNVTAIHAGPYLSIALRAHLS